MVPRVRGNYFPTLFAKSVRLNGTKSRLEEDWDGGAHEAEGGTASPAHEDRAWVTALHLCHPVPASPSLRVSFALAKDLSPG